MTWDNGYNGVACAEYYLRTGDRSVLPILQHYCDDAKRRQIYNIGWNHWDYRIQSELRGGRRHDPFRRQPGVADPGSGQGVRGRMSMRRPCWVRSHIGTALPAMAPSRWPTSAPGTSSDPAAATGPRAAVMHVASGAKGNTTIYKKAKEAFAMSALTSWPSREYSGRSSGKACRRPTCSNTTRICIIRRSSASAGV